MSVLVILAVAFLAGIGMGLVFPAPLLAVGASVLGGCLVVLASLVSGRVIAIVLTTTVFLLGWTRPLEKQQKTDEAPFSSCIRLLEGRIASPPVYLEGQSRITIDLQYWSDCLTGPQMGDLKAKDGRMYVTVVRAKEMPFGRGDHIRLRANTKPLVHRRNPGQPARKSENQRFTAVIAGINQLALLKTSASTIGRGFDLVRNDLAHFWNSALDSEQANLARALTLGESQVLSFAQRERFRLTGTAHLLSVSGLHLGLAVFFQFFILCRLLIHVGPLARRTDVGCIAAWCAIPIAIAFTLLVGCRIPVVRACVMVVSALLARALGRPSGTVPALALAGAALLASQPESLLNPGFQLSFTAVLSFFVTLRRDKSSDPLSTLRESDPKPSRIKQTARYIGNKGRDLLYSSIAAASATTPIVLYHFGYVSLMTVPANLLAVPMTGFLIMPGLLLVNFLAGPFPTVAAVLAQPVGLLLRCIDQLLEFISHAPLTFENPGVFLTSAVVIASVAMLFFLAQKKRAGLVLLVFAALSAIAAPFRDPPHFLEGRLTLDFLDVGQGDSVLMTFPDGRHWLVDAGGSGSRRFNVGERIVVPTLRALSVGRIDKLVVTHPEQDHVGGMPEVLKSFEVTEIWENGQGVAEGAGTSYQELLHIAKHRGIPVKRTPQLCTKHHVAGVQVEVIHPCLPAESYDKALSFNNNSLVLLIRYGWVTIALTGDIQKETEEDLVERGVISHVDVLKLAHHGSATSSSASFLDAATPIFGIASLGPFNRHGIPHKAVLGRLKSRRIRLYRTDISGAIRLVTDGRQMSFKPAVSSQ